MKKVNKTIKNIIKTEVENLIKEYAIRQLVFEDEPKLDDMILKVPQSKKDDFRIYLLKKKINFDHIADDEMDDYSHYLIYDEISDSMLSDLEQTYNASL